MSKSERREMLPTKEDLFADMMTPDSIPEWKIGKKFIVVDDRASLVFQFQSPSDSDSIKGRIFEYAGLEKLPTPGGVEVAVLKFNLENKTVRYNTGRSEKDVMTMNVLDLPMLIDVDLVSHINSMMAGKKYWLKTSLWYDKNGDPIYGKKFIPVTITRVKEGNSIFHLVVDFTDENADSASLYMNVRAKAGVGAESRTFPALFRMTDPRTEYPAITDENWNLIQQGKVAVGMTKAECKLALGNPSEVDAGHNWSSTIDVWRYKDGSFLHFEDGLLVNYRH